MSWLPQYHDLGLIGGIVAPLHHGMASALMSPIAFLRNPRSWLDLVSSTGAVCSGAPNFAFDFCVRRTSAEERARLDLSRWRTAFSAGEPIRAETLDRFAEAFAPSGFRAESFQPCYGLAEATLLVTTAETGEGASRLRVDAEALEAGRAEPAADGRRARTLVSCGRTLRGQRVEVVDPVAGTPSAPLEVGEIWIAGPSVARGYWRKPEATRETFHARLPDAEERFLRSGDLGFATESGELFVTSRLKDLIIIRGRNYCPQDIEATVDGAHAAVRPGCSAAFSVSGDGDEHLVVVCEVKPDAAADLAEVRRRVAEAVGADHQLAVADVVLIEARTLPKTSSGKVRRGSCRDAYRSGELAVAAAR